MMLQVEKSMSDFPELQEKCRPLKIVYNINF